MRVRIEYCDASGYVGRAAGLAGRLLGEFTNRLSGLELVPSADGVFEVDFDAERVFSRRELGRLPEDEEILGQAESRLGPTNTAEHQRRMREVHEQAFGDWLYPNVRYDSGGLGDDGRFVHFQGETEDSIEQVGEYYWAKLQPDRPMIQGQSYRMDGEKPWFIFRSPEGSECLVSMVMYVTDERSISVFLAPTGEQGRLNLYLTSEAH
jgi:selenoprotein W-related protein